MGKPRKDLDGVGGGVPGSWKEARGEYIQTVTS